MDGVIIDSEPMHLIAYQEMLMAHGIVYTDEDNREYLGKKDIVILESLKVRHGLPGSPSELVAVKEAILARLLATIDTPQPGLRRILDEARSLGLPMAVASSATLPTIELVVRNLGIGAYFHNLTSGDEVAHGKPAPDVFLLAASRLAVAPRDCLVIEDTYNGIAAAKAAGMACVAIPCQATRHQDHSQADMRLTSMEELDLHAWAAPACQQQHTS